MIRYLFLLSTWAGCLASSSVMEYRYADGNGNSFIVTPGGNNYLEYKPVTREESSSGEYDGGKPVRREISAGELARIKTLIDAATSNKSEHIENRVKGSGLISVSGASGSNTYLIRGNSKEVAELENYLRTLLQ